MKRGVTTGMMAAGAIGVVGGLAGWETVQDMQQKPPFNPAERLMPATKHLITETFRDAQRFWVQRGAGEVAATKLVILQGDESLSCPGAGSDKGSTLKANDTAAIAFCRRKNTVVFSQAGINATRYLAGRRQLSANMILKYTAAHEVGHAAQQAEGIPVPEDREALQAQELDADCRSGMVLAHYSPGDIQIAERAQTVGLYKADPTHGTEEQRFKSFMTGARTGSCPPLPVGE